MATDAVRIDVPQPESVEQLAREADLLKNKLAEERAKLNDVDCKSVDLYTRFETTLVMKVLPYFSRLQKNLVWHFLSDRLESSVPLHTNSCLLILDVRRNLCNIF